MDNYEDFRKYFGKSLGGKFWKTITKESLITLKTVIDKELFIRTVFNEISTSKYQPTKPRGYILINKGNSVARLVPVLNPKDICIYYYCTKKIESKISGNRVPNTYGGWRLGGEIRKNENHELKEISNSMRTYEMPDGTEIGFDESGQYSMEASFNPKAWKENWQDFNRVVYTHSRQDKFQFVAELDIANFYDNLSLESLEKKLKNVSANPTIVKILLKFLINWDKSVDLAGTVRRGIPQDEIGDCSRVIANFYLQEFDLEMFYLCKQYNAKYFRYADDQIILAQSKEDLREIIAKASVMILKHGLCFNSTKTKIMNKKEFEEYLSFDWFIERSGIDSVDEKTFKQDLKYYENQKTKMKNFGISVFLRILWLAPLNINKSELNSLINILINILINKDFLSSPKLEVWQLNKIYELLDKQGKQNFISELRKMSSTVVYNRFHFVLLKFFRSIGEDIEPIEEQIKDLEILFNLKTL